MTALSHMALSQDVLTRAGGGVPSPFAALRLTDFTQFEPGGVGTFMSTPPSDLGGNLGWSFSVLGGVGKSVTDPFDGWYAVGPVMKDTLGNALSPTDAWTVATFLAERTAPDLSSDIQVMFGVLNEASDSASVRAGAHGVLYSAATRAGRKVMVIAGAATFVGGATSANIRYIPGNLHKTGTGAASVLVIGDGRALDTNRAPLTNNFNTGQQDATAWGDVAPRLFLAVHRTSTTDTTTRTVVVSPYAQGACPSSLPA